MPKNLNNDQKKKLKALSLKMLRQLEKLSLNQIHAYITCDEFCFLITYCYDSKLCREDDEAQISGES